MKKYVSKFPSLVFAGVLLLGAAPALAQGTVVYDSIPSPTPPNVPSVGFQCCQNAELGDRISLEVDTPRRAGFATVLMSDWAKHSDYPSMPTVGYTHPITLNIYVDDGTAAAHTPVQTVTQDFLIPWRPEADPTCPGGTAWRAADHLCYNGFAFTIKFDLRSFNYDLPEQFIYGIAYNTQTWGYAPTQVAGPYNSLNVGLHVAPPPVAVGTDVNADVIYRNLNNGGFLPAAGWTPYTPAVQFTTIAHPTTADSCKNGAWKNLVRSDFTSFKNQGACVSYVNTGK